MKYVLKKSCLMLTAMFAASCLFGQAIEAAIPQTRTKAQFEWQHKNVDAFTAYQDVRFMYVNEGLTLAREQIETLTFDRLTEWNADNRAMAEETLRTYANPGLGVRAVHAKGITGKGVAVAIIDQNLAGEHPEFAGKLREYRDLGCDQEIGTGSMHGPAVASLLVGNACGTAPGAVVYYFATPSWKADAKYFADALYAIVDINKRLAEADRIRVVSVSAAPSGKGSPFKENNKDWDKAVKKATAANILVLDCTESYGFIDSGYCSPEDPENPELVKSGWPKNSPFPTRNGRICAPCSKRTVAEEYQKGESSYAYFGQGGLSWAIPFVAGACALAWQVNPDITASEMKELLINSAHVTKEKVRVIDPPALVELAKAR